MASARSAASSNVMPRRKTAIVKAPIWPSETEPRVAPSTKNRISSALKANPSRFLRMTSWG